VPGTSRYRFFNRSTASVTMGHQACATDTTKGKGTVSRYVPQT
jgi:hypothetical protein